MRLGAWSLLAVAILSVSARVGMAATPAEVEAAIQKGIKALYGAQQGGIWDPINPGVAEKRLHWGGETALATYALMAAGESPQDAKLAKAIEFLKTADITGIYALGIRAQMWDFLPQNAENKAFIRRDGELLLGALKPTGDGRGMFNYPVKDKGDRYDHSVSQYGVLGLWAVAQLGLEIPTPAWKLMDDRWRAHQLADGAWEYIHGRGDPRASMTAAGVATLFITQEYLNMGKGAECNGNIRDPNIEKGLKWMSEHFKGRESYYTLYGVERIGVASGYKYFGTVDWYDQGAEFLVRSQAANGSWGENVPNTAFAILFLVRGRAPVVMNKLEYELDGGPGEKARLANWNQRPRDCANLVRWMGKQLERDMNWQIVNLRVPIDDLHDAPILYIAGNQNLDFTDEQEKKLRRFVEQGGMIFGNADCANLAFAASFQKLGHKLFPDYEFRDLPKEHLIFTTPYHHSRWRVAPIVRGLTNGARELMVLIPTADYSKHWQVQSYGGREESHQLMWNLYFYAVDKKDMRYKGQTYIVHASPQVKPVRQIAVARIEYAGNWNPEPGGWRRLHNVLHNKNQTDLQVKPVKLGSGNLLAGGYKVAHLTGTTRFALGAPALDELQKFVDGGGTLIVDACGGSAEFAQSAEVELRRMFPDARPQPLPPEHPVFQAGAKTAQVEYRAFARKVVGGMRAPRVKAIEVGGRPAVLVSNEDLSTGLVGMSIDGIYGYEPQSATDLMRNMLFFASGGGTPIEPPAVAAKPPAKAPPKPKATEPKRDGAKEKPKDGSKPKDGAKRDGDAKPKPDMKKDGDKK